MISELLKAIFEYEAEKAAKTMDYHPNYILIHPGEPFYNLASDPNWIKYGRQEGYKFYFMGIPLIRTIDVEKFEIK